MRFNMNINLVLRTKNNVFFDFTDKHPADSFNTLVCLLLAASKGKRYRQGAAC